MQKEPESMITIKECEDVTMNFPVQWAKDEELHEMGWIFTDENEKEFLRVRFSV